VRVAPKLYQVFVGCPFRKNIRANYDRLKAEIEAETPLSLVLADSGTLSSTDYLLQRITELISSSAACIFDVTGGNPNVSLEVGIAHTFPADYLLCMKTRKSRTQLEREAELNAKREGEVKAIISDLQGKNRVEYKAYAALRRQVEKRYLDSLPFMQRWLQFKTENRGMAPYAVKLFDQIRSSGRSQRPRLTAILEGSGFSASDVSTALSKHKLLVAQRGREGGYFYPTK
jgi:hypothetical protein